MKPIKRIRSILVLVSVLVIAILGIYFYKVLNGDFIHKGVKIDEFDVSLMTRDEALNLIKSQKEKDKYRTMQLTHFDRVFEIPLVDIGFEYDYMGAVEKAYRVGRNGNAFKRLFEIISTRIKGTEFQLEIIYDKAKIEDAIENISKEIDVEPKDAQIQIRDGNIDIIDEVVGKKVNREKLIEIIEENLYKNKLDNVQIPIENTIPKISSDLLSRINGVIGEFSTSFSGSSQNRIENIELSANAIKGTLLMPGETMSFNETTGPRKREFGYKEADVIINGEFTPGVGGGVCQTSTTLYNALLLADVTILERAPHSIPPSYISLGMDAAVSYGYLDLKFRNDFDYPIYIDSKIVGDRLYFYIYGDAKGRDFTVKIESEVVETIRPKEETIFDKALEPGTKILVQEGRIGYKVNTYKYIMKDGKIISKELISQDYYREKNYVYKVGEDSKAENNK